MKPSEQVKLKSDNNHPVIALVVHSGFAARYLLRTKIYQRLCELGAKVIILTPNVDEPYLRREFAQAQTTIVSLNVTRCEHMMRTRFWHTIWSYTYLYGCPLENPLLDMRLERATASVGWRRTRGYLTRWFIHRVRNSARLRRYVRVVDESLNRTSLYESFFRQYKPDVLVTVSPGYQAWLTDALLIRESHALGVKTVAAIYAWDNPSTKGLPAALPDYVIVWSEMMRHEIMTALDFAPARIRISGPAIFDVYGAQEWTSRAEFLEKYNLNADQPVIFFATMSPNRFPHNADYLRQLACAVQQRQIDDSCQLIVRLHPIYFRQDISAHLEGELENYRALEREFPFIRYSIPQILSEKLSMDMPSQEMRDVATLVKHSDLVVSFFSTLQVEAAVCDTPFVTINYDLAHRRRDSVRPSEFALHNHNHRAVVSGAGRVAQSLDEMVKWINFYLADKSEDKEARRAFAVQECDIIDGHAGERAGEQIFEIAVGGHRVK